MANPMLLKSNNVLESVVADYTSFLIPATAMESDTIYDVKSTSEPLVPDAANETLLGVNDIMHILNAADDCIPAELVLQMLKSMQNEHQLQLFNFVYEQEGTLPKAECHAMWKKI